MTQQRADYPLDYSKGPGGGRHDESTLPGTLERDRVELVADANETIVSALMGGSFADDRGNAVFAASWSQRDSVGHATYRR